MPTYFFDAFDGERPVVDLDGLELETDDAARELAIATVHDLMREHPTERESNLVRVSVRRDGGEPMYSVECRHQKVWIEKDLTAEGDSTS